MNTDMHDPFNLQRFVAAQEDCYKDALAELKRGRKTSHWMWYVFPQLIGLGHSEIAQFYAIRTAEEAAAYLSHPILGRRLLECCECLLQVQDRTASEIFGFPDDMKLKSSVTLFSTLTKRESVFDLLIGKYFNGNADQRTLELLEAAQ